MKSQKILVIISSIINIALLGFALFILATGIEADLIEADLIEADLLFRVGLFLTIFPLMVGMITYFIVRKFKKFPIIKVIIYFNIAYFLFYLILPLGAFVVVWIWTLISKNSPPPMPMYGMPL